MMIDQLARFLFDRQADTYESDPTLRELAWADPEIRGSWIVEAIAVTDFLETTV